MMQERRCSVCGRILRRWPGTIGPVCGRIGKPKVGGRKSRKNYAKLMERIDIFKELNNEQRKDANPDSKAKK